MLDDKASVEEGSVSQLFIDFIVFVSRSENQSLYNSYFSEISGDCCRVNITSKILPYR